MKNERILCAAIKVEGVGQKWDDVYTGLRHGDCFALISRIRKRFTKDDGVRIRILNNSTQGFLTTKNRFVDRRSAFVIAKREGQIIHKHGTKNELYSEDIY